MPARALPGFRDFYPDDTALRNHIFAVWRTVASRYGFEEYDGPPLEPLELYTQKSGPEIVGQLYHFRDRGDREVALRPEMTPTLARMVAARAAALKKPIRWFSMPQLFRYERQQRTPGGRRSDRRGDRRGPAAGTRTPGRSRTGVGPAGVAGAAPGRRGG
ncbi:MAG: ATP phosphoribosyltransferase regulatory subunit [Gemmatimonadetes bacterium]|nr:ATP phosphoribosyltransferase regulatory subunit [Gemmatimonadota bacterium]